MKRIITLLFSGILILALFAFLVPSPALAQEETPPPAQPGLTISTTYPSQVAELGENVTLSLKIHAIGEAQTVSLEMADLPVGWTATFRGGGRIVHAVYVDADSTENVTLRLEPPENAESGTCEFTVRASAGRLKAELPITLMVQEKVPASLTLSADLLTIKGSPKTTFRYNLRLENSGDEEIMVNLTADAPDGLLLKFKVAGKETTSFPLGANSTKTVTLELDPIVELSAGSYPFTVYAAGGSLEAKIDLTAEVVGQQDLSITGPDGLLSGKANAGKETTLPVVVRNTGTAPAQGVEMSASAPTGWTVAFDPEIIPEIAAGDQAEATMILKPADKAVAGDYVVTVRAHPADSASVSADFRITVATSTLWGIVGIALIAVAVGVVAMAVARYGRR